MDTISLIILFSGLLCMAGRIVELFCGKIKIFSFLGDFYRFGILLVYVIFPAYSTLVRLNSIDDKPSCIVILGPYIITFMLGLLIFIAISIILNFDSQGNEGDYDL